MRKKLLTLLLAVAASVGTMFAWDYERVQIGDLYYNLDATNQTAEVTSENSSSPYWSTTITTANIPASVEYNSVAYTVTSIGVYAFSGCTGLSSVTIPNSVTSIGNSAFYACSSLTSVNIPNSVTNIEGYAFESCSSLPVLDNIRYADTYLVSALDNLTTYSIKAGTKWIGNYAFRGCTNLTSIVIPNTVISIGNSAFYGCSNLVSVNIPDNVQNIDSYTFYGCSSLPVVDNIRYADTYLLEVVDHSLTTFTIKEGTKWIGYKAFNYCTDMTSIEIPSTVISIGENAFEMCSNMISISIPNSVTSIGNRAFYNCTGLTSFSIPNSVTSIGDETFYKCTGLTSIIIPESVSKMGYSTFSGCSSLTSVMWEAMNCNDFTRVIRSGIAAHAYSPFYNIRTQITSFVFGNKVKHIPANLCHSMLSLTAISIPNSVNSIGEGAFTNCTGLTSITCKAMNPPSLGSYVFGSVNKSIPLYVPEESVVAYQSADQWKDFTNILSIPCEPQILHDTIETCQGEMIPWIPMTISTNMPGSYDYYDSLKNIMGCDSILHYHVIVHPSYEFLYDTTVYVGDEIRWRNWNLKPEKAGRYQYFDTLRTYFYCDSVFVLNLEVKPRSQKMCSWLVESNDLEMGAVVTSFNNEYYQYGTQITVEASPNSGYKFVKWNDGKKFNPYKFSLLDDKYLLAIFMEEEEEQDTTTVQPSSTSATFTWPFIGGGFSYSLTIYLDVACTIPFCTITFNQYGQLIGITFGNRAPRRTMEQEDGFTYTVSGLDANTEYYFKMETMDEDNKLINTDEGAFRTTNDATGIENPYNNTVEYRKVMINGQIYILRGDKTYTLQGQEVK